MTEEAKTVTHSSPSNGVDGMLSKGSQWNTPAVVAALTALVFALSAAREWAYYRVIGLDFIFLGSPSDYTNATLRVLPMSFVAGAVGLVAGRMTFWFVAVSPDPSQSNKEIAERGIRFGYWFSTLMAVAGFVMVGFLQMTRGDIPSKVWLLPGIGCWGVVFLWLIKHPYGLFDGPAMIWRQLFFYGPLVAALIIADGYDEAVSDLALPRGEYRIVHSTDLVEDDVQLLRATSKGVLILRVPTRDVSFLTYQSFKSIDRIGASQ